jgi:attractin
VILRYPLISIILNTYFPDDLAIDYQFTFNLSKSDDKHFTAINFKNEPTKVDVNVDFSISCSVAAKMNLTYRFTPAHAKEGQETVLYSEVNCSVFKERFSKDQYVFGDSENTTFYVYVYEFEPPLWIVISFSQHPKLDLLQFFITFST